MGCRLEMGKFTLSLCWVASIAGCGGTAAETDASHRDPSHASAAAASEASRTTDYTRQSRSVRAALDAASAAYQNGDQPLGDLLVGNAAAALSGRPEDAAELAEFLEGEPMVGINAIDAAADAAMTAVYVVDPGEVRSLAAASQRLMRLREQRLETTAEAEPGVSQEPQRPEVTAELVRTPAQRIVLLDQMKQWVADGAGSHADIRAAVADVTSLEAVGYADSCLKRLEAMDAATLSGPLATTLAQAADAALRPVWGLDPDEVSDPVEELSRRTIERIDARVVAIEDAIAAPDLRRLEELRPLLAKKTVAVSKDRGGVGAKTAALRVLNEWIAELTEIATRLPPRHRSRALDLLKLTNAKAARCVASRLQDYNRHVIAICETAFRAFQSQSSLSDLEAKAILGAIDAETAAQQGVANFLPERRDLLLSGLSPEGYLLLQAADAVGGEPVTQLREQAKEAAGKIVDGSEDELIVPRRNALIRVDQTLLDPPVQRLFSDVLGKLMSEFGAEATFEVQKEMSDARKRLRLEEF